MNNSCNHVLGIWDSEYSVVGRNIQITVNSYMNRSSLARMHPEDMEWFSYCPECGSKITKEMKE